MMKITRCPILSLFFLILFNCAVFAADWYIRPSQGVPIIYGLGNGKSYNDAFSSPGNSVPDTVISVDIDNDILKVSGTPEYLNNVPVMFKSTGTLPSPLKENTIYWIRLRVDKYNLKVSSVQFGSIINLTSCGSGTIRLFSPHGILWDDIEPGDTIWICDNFADVDFTGSYGYTNRMSILKSGTAGAPITIRADTNNPIDPAPDINARNNPGVFYALSGRIGSGWVASLPSPEFAGTGLNDMSSQGSPTTTNGAVYTVEIDGNGASDTFKWKKNSGSYTTAVTITGANQTLTDGVAVKFNNTTGHTLGDIWTITTGANGTYQYTFSSGNHKIYYEDKTKVNRAVVFGGSIRPTLAQLNSFSAGDNGYYNTVMYIKCLSGSSNPNDHVYLASHNIQEAINTQGKDYINIKNISIKTGGIAVGGSQHVNIDNCNMELSRYGVSILGSDSIIVSNCVIDYCADGIYFLMSGGKSTNCTIENNTITNCDRYGYVGSATNDAHSIGIMGGENNIIRYNIINNCATGPCLYSSYASDCSIEIYGNFISNTNFSASTGMGIEAMLGPNHSGKWDIKIYNNIIVNPYTHGIEANTARTSWKTSQPVKIYNNVINNAGASSIRVCGFQNYEVWADVRNNICHTKNNYFAIAQSTLTSVSAWNLVWDYNSYYPNVESGSPFYFINNGGAGSKSFSQWKGLDFSPDTHSIASDPKLIYIAKYNLRLQSGSPCIKAGVDVGLSTDFQGNKWRNPPSIGAIEYYKIGGIISPRTLGGPNYDPQN